MFIMEKTLFLQRFLIAMMK